MDGGHGRTSRKGRGCGCGEEEGREGHHGVAAGGGSVPCYCLFCVFMRKKERRERKRKERKGENENKKWKIS
jgi:hypothetical protein